VGRDNSVAKSERKRTDRSKPSSDAWATFLKNVYNMHIGNGIHVYNFPDTCATHREKRLNAFTCK